jgi:hypothetical protein
MRTTLTIGSATLLVVAAGVLIQALPVAFLLADSGRYGTYLFVWAAQLVGVPLGAWLGGILFDRGAVRIHLASAAAAALVGAALFLAAGEGFLWPALGSGLLGVFFGLATTLAFAAVGARVTFAARPAALAALLLGSLIVVNVAFSLVLWEPFTLAIAGGALLVGGIGVAAALASPVRGGTSVAIGPAVAPLAAVMLGMVAIFVGIESSRVAASFLIIPLQNVSIEAITLFRFVSFALGLGLVALGGRAFLGLVGTTSADVRAIVILAMVGLVSGVLAAAFTIQAAMEGDFTAYGALVAAGLLIGILVSIGWLARQPTSTGPVRLGAVLLAMGGALIVVQLFVGRLPTAVLVPGVLMAGVGAGLAILVVRACVADAPLDVLGRLTAASVVAAHAGTQLGTMAASTLSTMTQEIELDPAWGLTEVVTVIAASLLVLVLGLRATGRQPERRPSTDPLAA